MKIVAERYILTTPQPSPLQRSEVIAEEIVSGGGLAIEVILPEYGVPTEP